MVKTGSECQLTDYMSSRGKNCYGNLLRGCVVPAKVLACGRRDIQRVGCGVGWERSTQRTTGRDTAQTERILMRLVDTSSLDSRLHHPGKRVFARHPCIELSPFLLSLPVLHARFVVPSESLLLTWLTW